MSLLLGDQDLPTSGKFDGMVAGNARVVGGSDVEVAGMIDGDLIIEAGARVVFTGMVKGRIINHGADIEMRGMVG